MSTQSVKARLGASTAPAAATQAPAPSTLPDLRPMHPREQVKAIIESRRPDLEALLPAHLSMDRVVQVALMCVTTTPALLECEPKSIVAGIAQSMALGLELGGPLGHAYLVPYSVNAAPKGQPKRWVKRAQLIPGYRGYMHLARQSGRVRSIQAHLVHEADMFSVVYGTEPRLIHKPALNRDRGSVLGAYAVADLGDGAWQYEYMTVQEIERIKLGSQSKGEWGPWRDHWGEMARKTAVRRLAKYLPLSIEMARATVLDDYHDSGRDQALEELTPGAELPAIPYDEPEAVEYTPAEEAP